MRSIPGTPPATPGFGAGRRPEALVAVAAELLGADLGTARGADLERAARAAALAAGAALDPGALAERLRSAAPDDAVRAAFVEALTIHETQFFRVRGQFEALAEWVLPDLIARRGAARRLLLWSAGCSTGEEAWSLAILLERLAPRGFEATVLATDVDERALEHARRGIYGSRSFRDTPDWLRARWFTPTDDGWEVRPDLRPRVRFAPLNLVSDPYPSVSTGTSEIDLLLCRNVLIYFTPEARSRAAARLAACIAPGGWLAVAPAELGAVPFPGLALRQFPGAILHQRPDPRGPEPGPPPTLRPSPPRPEPAPPPAPARRSRHPGPPLNDDDQNDDDDDQRADIAREEALVLEAGGECYAVDLASVERVHPVEALTRLPGLRPPWAGLVSLRGEILPALDLPALHGRPPSPSAGGAHPASCAVVAAGGLRVALLSEVPIALRVVDDLVTVLDVPTLLADAALVVDDDGNRT